MKYLNELYFISYKDIFPNKILNIHTPNIYLFYLFLINAKRFSPLHIYLNTSNLRSNLSNEEANFTRHTMTGYFQVLYFFTTQHNAMKGCKLHWKYCDILNTQRVKQIPFRLLAKKCWLTHLSFFAWSRFLKEKNATSWQISFYRRPECACATSHLHIWRPF